MADSVQLLAEVLNRGKVSKHIVLGLSISLSYHFAIYFDHLGGNDIFESGLDHSGSGKLFMVRWIDFVDMGGPFELIANIGSHNWYLLLRNYRKPWRSIYLGSNYNSRSSKSLIGIDCWMNMVRR